MKNEELLNPEVYAGMEIKEWKEIDGEWKKVPFPIRAEREVALIGREDSTIGLIWSANIPDPAKGMMLNFFIAENYKKAPDASFEQGMKRLTGKLSDAKKEGTLLAEGTTGLMYEANLVNINASLLERPVRFFRVKVELESGKEEKDTMKIFGQNLLNAGVVTQAQIDASGHFALPVAKRGVEAFVNSIKQMAFGRKLKS
jgi:hypothetical protein